MAGIYIHIPFCRQACHYCDFHFSTNLKGRAQMMEAICLEVQLTKAYLQNQTINTIYFGGGTPSLLLADEIEKIYNRIITTYTVSPDCEITFEANPDDLTDTYVKDLLTIGINRLSIGIQSFSDHLLMYMNRVHTSINAFESVVTSQRLGLTNISIDLIYGLPGVNHEAWEKDIKTALSLNVPHISAYCLTIEPKTVFGRWHAKGRLQIADDDFAATQYETLVQSLTIAGYQGYEISNFCKPGWESRHNSNYWSGTAYLGLGPGAHSYNGAWRQSNISDNGKYVASVLKGIVPNTIEYLSEEEKLNEYILTSIRTSGGLDVEKVTKWFPSLATQYGLIAHHLESNLLAVYDKSMLRLTLKGKLIADEITSKLMV